MSFCETKSLTPLWVTITFTALSFVMLLFTLTLSIKHLKTTSKYANKNGTNAWEKATFTKKVKLVARDVWGRKSVYLRLISHLSDTATDFASVIEFGIVAASSNSDNCGINVWYLFTISIICMIGYRLISAYKIYQITDGSWLRTILQLMDIELYHVLYFSHKWGLRQSSSPQRMLSVLEAVFEVYLMYTNNGSAVVIASTALSFVNLTISIIADDAK
eukprot:52355_1